MSAIVLEAVRQSYTEEALTGEPAPSSGAARPRLVLVTDDAVPVGAPRRARPAQPPLRLTRFGRLVVSLVLAAVVAVLGVGLAGQLASATGEPRTVTVQSGQTLSGIAARELPDRTIAEGVVELQVANSLSTTAIHAGQQLVVPAH